jgi:hypothetical protein
MSITSNKPSTPVYPVQDVTLYNFLLPLCDNPTEIVDTGTGEPHEFRHYLLMYLDLYMRYYDFYGWPRPKMVRHCKHSLWPRLHLIIVYQR